MTGLSLGPSIKDDDLLEIEVTAVFKNQMARKIMDEAKKRGREPVELMADVIEIVADHNLWQAVLDD